MNKSLNQILHSEFIRSPLWNEIRLKALEFHGRKCNSCGSLENLEVHHKTYERFGGHELRILNWQSKTLTRIEWKHDRTKYY